MKTSWKYTNGDSLAHWISLSLCLNSVQIASASGQTQTTTITSNPNGISDATFDYVIAGAGLTGLVVANKLSETGAKVLVVEAGPDLNNFTAINDPTQVGLLSTTYRGICDWNYPVSGDGLEARNLTTSGGRCVGGSTCINGMVWYRPVPAEFDAIGELGNPGWSWQALEPLLTSAEHFNPPTAQQRSDGASYVPSVHGFTGPVEASFIDPIRAPDSQALYKETMPQVFNGLEVGKDLSARTGSVFASTAYSIKNIRTNSSIRSSAARSWLYPANEQRSSLTVLTSHLVTRVLFDTNSPSGKDTPRATGVEIASSDGKGTTFHVKTSKEVILAAGALGSAPLLERSGIGSTTILSQHNISTLVNLPGVGFNMHDQAGTAITATVKAANTSNPRLIDSRSNPFAPVIALVNLKQLFGEEADQIASELKANVSSRARAAVNAGLLPSYEGALELFGKLTELIVDQELPVAEIIGESYVTGEMMSVPVWPLLPFSRGTVHISSSDPFAFPTVIPHYNKDPFDLRVAVASSKAARQLFHTFPLSSVIDNPDADPPNVNTDEEWAEWFIQTSFGVSHIVGSTAMLPFEKGGVVDSRFRVYGTRGLRVVDAGTLPLELTSHLSLALYGTAQKAASLILEDNH